MCDVLKQTNVETKSETSVVSYTRGKVRAGPENKLRVVGACKCHVTSELSKCFTLREMQLKLVYLCYKILSVRRVCLEE